ncbi:MAG: dihydrofolate reductase, partial [Brachybacterium tyrofermentans]
GGSVYREAIADADLLVVTEIDLEVDGDTTAPEVPDRFGTPAADPATGWLEAKNGLRYRILTYTR